jgi:hypothetical protein
MMTRSIPLTWIAASILVAASPALAQHHRENHGSKHAAETNAVWTAPTLDVAR